MNTESKRVLTPIFGDHFDPNQGRAPNNDTSQRELSVVFVLLIYPSWCSVSRHVSRLHKTWNTNKKNIAENRGSPFSVLGAKGNKNERNTHRTQHRKRLNQTKKDCMWCFSYCGFFIKPCQYLPIGNNKTVRLSLAVKLGQQNWASVRSLNLLELSMSIYALPRQIKKKDMAALFWHHSTLLSGVSSLLIQCFK